MSEHVEGDALPYLIPGGLAVDDRGSLTFFNELRLRGFERQYFVSNHRQGFVRAWHGHRREGKAVVAIQGSALVCAVAISDWTTPDPESKVHRFILSSHKPTCLLIPAGYANGFMTLTSDTLLQFLSTSSLEDSLEDDGRFDARYWDPWHVEER